MNYMKCFSGLYCGVVVSALASQQEDPGLNPGWGFQCGICMFSSYMHRFFSMSSTVHKHACSLIVDSKLSLGCKCECV